MKASYLIAEIGVNHSGNLAMALEMVNNAKLAGASAVKFQTYKTENLITKNAPKANYQKKTTNTNETQFQMLKISFLVLMG